jgi:hypothetical protein
MNSYEILMLVKVVEIFSILSPSENGLFVNNVQWNLPLMFLSLRFPLIWWSISIRIFSPDKNEFLVNQVLLFVGTCKTYCSGQNKFCDHVQTLYSLKQWVKLAFVMNCGLYTSSLNPTLHSLDVVSFSDYLLKH